MRKMKGEPRFQDFDFYLHLVIKARQLAGVPVRQSLLGTEVNRQLEHFGGYKVWFTILGLSVLGLIYFGSQSNPWSEIAVLCCVAMLSYALLLHGFSATIGDIYILFPHRRPKNTAYSTVASIAFGRLSIGVILPLWLLSIFVLSLISITLAYRVLVIAMSISAVWILASLFTLSLKNLSDYRSILAAIFGFASPNIISNTQLILALKADLDEGGHCLNVKKLIKVAENDLRHAEIQLQLTNIVLAVVAILISMAFSQQIVTLLSELIVKLDNIFSLISQMISSLLGLGQIVERVTYIGLWWWIINLTVGAGFLVSRALLSTYFSNYRPAYALHQTLNWFEGNRMESATLVKDHENELKC